MRPNKTALLILALRSRGYSEVTVDPDLAVYRCFAISPTHARRICGHQKDSHNRLWLSLQCNLRHGPSWSMGKPIHRHIISGLQRDGLELWSKTEKARQKAELQAKAQAQAQPPAKPISLTRAQIEAFLSESEDSK